MSDLKGKKGIIMGVANGYSLAAGVAKEFHDRGAEIVYSYLPDATGKMEKRVRRVVDELNPVAVLPCNVNDDADLDTFFQEASGHLCEIDFLVHSIAFAPLDDLRKPSTQASREAFKVAMESSVYSFMTVAGRVGELMGDSGGSIMTMSSYGAEKALPGYNLMGIAKAALESAVRYAAWDLGEKGIRVNGISAGPVKTLASSAVGDFSKMLAKNAATCPLKRNTSKEEVGKAAVYLASDLSTGTTGEILHVDCGYHAMGTTAEIT